MVALRADIDNAARTNAKVLILGNTGVGKEVVARLIHLGSARSARPCIAVNCSGIPETLLSSELFGHARGSFTGAYRDKIGLLRQADGGTLFLDELGEMSLMMQAMLLRFAETGEIQPVGVSAPVGRTNVRLITATNRDLSKMMAEGAFREDLYYRLNVVQIRIPPLRERGTDVLLLFRHYLMQASQAHGLPCPELTREAEDVLLGYDWPGNVRELRNVTERLALRDARGPITANDLPRDVRSMLPAPTLLAGAPPVLERPSASTSEPSGPYVLTPAAERLWNQLMAGGDFWSVVHQPFRQREVTRADLTALVDHGLRHTCGSYRALVRMCNLPATDYKRFHAFLYQQNCNLSVAPYRAGAAHRSLPASAGPRYSKAG
jgi:DNA-binding NtrC family response regulator